MFIFKYLILRIRKKKKKKKKLSSSTIESFQCKISYSLWTE